MKTHSSLLKCGFLILFYPFYIIYTLIIKVRAAVGILWSQIQRYTNYDDDDAKFKVLDAAWE